jgi:hypothetical protein
MSPKYPKERTSSKREEHHHTKTCSKDPPSQVVRGTQNTKSRTQSEEDPTGTSQRKVYCTAVKAEAMTVFITYENHLQ